MRCVLLHTFRVGVDSTDIAARLIVVAIDFSVVHDRRWRIVYQTASVDRISFSLW